MAPHPAHTTHQVPGQPAVRTLEAHTKRPTYLRLVKPALDTQPTDTPSRESFADRYRPTRGELDFYDRNAARALVDGNGDISSKLARYALWQKKFELVWNNLPPMLRDLYLVRVVLPALPKPVDDARTATWFDPMGGPYYPHKSVRNATEADIAEMEQRVSTITESNQDELAQRRSICPVRGRAKLRLVIHHPL